MPRLSSRAANPAAGRACVNCQKRKTRCLRSGDTGPCSYCARRRKNCSFEGPPDRTPLTRKNLDASEHRCAQLGALLQSISPGLDIDTALQQFESEPSPTEGPAPAEINDSTPDSYEWHEGSLSPECRSPNWGTTMTTDGMATLSTTDSGYLGSSAGSRLLEQIDSTITKGTKQRPQRRTHRKTHQLRSRPPEAPDIINSYVASQLIDAYFLLYNNYYPVLHEKTFRDRVATGQLQRLPHSPWRVTYYMVLAIGHWTSSEESEHLQSSYYTAARASLSLEMLESGTIETVQAFVLIGNYLQKRDRTNTGYNFVGLAYRMALGLGLHRESAGAENTIGHERRRQLFWTIFCVESGFNITLGRPPIISEGFIDINLPRNIDDKELSLMSPVPEEVDYPTTYSAIIIRTPLARIADAIYHEFLLAKTAGSRIEYRIAESMERELVQWRKGLPSYFHSMDVPSWFQGARSVARWKEQNARILLWRGSQKYHSFLPSKTSAEEKCLDAAMESIHDIATFCAMHDGNLYQGITWYATYFLLQATLVLVARFLDSTEAPSEDESSAWYHSVFKARDCLRVLAARNKSATRYLDMLDRVCSQFQSPALDVAQGQVPFNLSNVHGEGQVVTPGNDFSQNVENLLGLPTENDFALLGESQFALNDEAADPNFRMLVNQVSHDFMGSMPLDLLFNDWINYS